MLMLTDKKRLMEIQRIRQLRKASNDEIRIYNSSFAMKTNPFANDTSSLPFGNSDNRGNTHNNNQQPTTEDEVLEQLLNTTHHKRNKKSDIQLLPDAVSNEVREYWLDKINSSRLRGAIALKKQQ